MKKAATFILSLFILIGMLACNSEKDIKQDIFGLVKENRAALAEMVYFNDFRNATAIDGITSVSKSNGYIIFYCKGSGISASSQEYGFYYSPKDIPIAIFDGKTACAPEDMSRKGNGFQYTDTSFNSYYTEKIEGNFYYYSNSF